MTTRKTRVRLYIKGDYTKEIPFDYLELAKIMVLILKMVKASRFSYLEILAHLKQTQLFT